MLLAAERLVVWVDHSDPHFDRDRVLAGARCRASKAHSFFLYFLFSLVFFPAALIVAYMVHDRQAGHDPGRLWKGRLPTEDW